jgi:hypothetical protein
MLSDIEKATVALAAGAWLVKRKRFPSAWDVATEGWPDPAVCPVYAAVIPPDLLRVPMGAEAWSRALRNRHDPEEKQPWVFVAAPDPDDRAVWLVWTKQIAAAGN